jgi:hypothetical protein
MKNHRSPHGGMDAADHHEVYLLSAAHVLVGISNKKINIAQNNGSGRSLAFPCCAGELYITQEYMATGLKDYGFVKLLHLDGKASIKIQDNIGTTKWEEVVEAGKSVVAHGQVFLRGTVVTSSLDDGRFSVVPAHSVPGQGGILVFNNEKAVAGVVHGSSKHRSRHAAAAREDAAVTYCDTVGFRNLVCVDDEEKLDLLRLAESIPKDVASGSVTFGAFTETSNDNGEAAIMRDFMKKLELEHSTGLKLQTVMEKLRDKIVPGKQDPVSFLDPKLVLLTSFLPLVNDEELAAG